MEKTDFVVKGTEINSLGVMPNEELSLQRVQTKIELEVSTVSLSVLVGTYTYLSVYVNRVGKVKL